MSTKIMINFLQIPRTADEVQKVSAQRIIVLPRCTTQRKGRQMPPPFRASNITFSFQNTSIHIKGIFLAVQTLPDAKIQAIHILTADVHFL